MRCDVLDLYDETEIDLLSERQIEEDGEIVQKRVKITTKDKKNPNIYNLTVELDRAMALRVLTKDALKKLGYDGVTDFVRKSVEALVVRLEEIEKQEK